MEDKQVNRKAMLQKTTHSNQKLIMIFCCPHKQEKKIYVDDDEPVVEASALRGDAAVGVIQPLRVLKKINNLVAT